jgi:hypothetical protein
MARPATYTPIITSGASSMRRSPRSARSSTPRHYLTEDLTGRGIDFIDARRDVPFCLYLAHEVAYHPLESVRVSAWRQDAPGAANARRRTRRRSQATRPGFGNAAIAEVWRVLALRDHSDGLRGRDPLSPGRRNRRYPLFLLRLEPAGYRRQHGPSAHGVGR